jgi:twitching motility protein PilT
VEVMVATEAVRNLIREGKTHQIYAMLEAGGQWGMQTMDRALLNLYKKGRVSKELALLNAKNQEEMKRHMFSA